MNGRPIKTMPLERIKELPENDLTERNNVVKLDLVTGGKGPPSDFWLWNQEVGTIFLSRHKQNSVEATRTFVLGEFVVFNKTQKAMLLSVNEGNGQPRPVWVDPAKFSNQMELVEVLKTNAFKEVPLEEKEQEEANVEDLRSV